MNLLLVLICCLLLPTAANARGSHGEITGTVTTLDGKPIADALVITSSGGLSDNYANTNAVGSFHLGKTGAFVSFRHKNYNPQLIRTSELAALPVVKMSPADDRVTLLKPCPANARHGKYIGDGLRVNAEHHKGPVYGEHDSHWYVKRGKDLLHIASGPFWHSGLPVEERLTTTENVSVRGWVFNDIVGLDLSGRTATGEYWRWVGAPVAEEIEYRTFSRETADYFDEVISSMCFHSY